MQKVKIVTQSGCDLTFDLAAKHGIMMLPDFVIFGSTTYRNNLDIHAEDFYNLLESSPVNPSSAHPSPSDFIDAFESCGGYDDIICILMSEKTTGTINTVTMVTEMLKTGGFKPNIHIYDSKHVSYGLAIAALEAADLAAQGAGAEEIIEHLDNLVDKIKVCFTMKSLEYAKRGGRIGAIEARTADKLGLKPLLTFVDGNVTDIDVSNSFEKNVRSIEAKFNEEYCGGHRVVIFHADNLERAEKIREHILASHKDAEVYIQWVGPVVGIYTGRGCVGIAYVSK